MESQPQNPEFRNNPENFHPCTSSSIGVFIGGYCEYMGLDTRKPVFGSSQTTKEQPSLRLCSD